MHPLSSPSDVCGKGGQEKGKILLSMLGGEKGTMERCQDGPAEELLRVSSAALRLLTSFLCLTCG